MEVTFDVTLMGASLCLPPSSLRHFSAVGYILLLFGFHIVRRKDIYITSYNYIIE